MQNLATLLVRAFRKRHQSISRPKKPTRRWIFAKIFDILGARIFETVWRYFLTLWSPLTAEGGGDCFGASRCFRPSLC